MPTTEATTLRKGATPYEGRTPAAGPAAPTAAVDGTLADDMTRPRRRRQLTRQVIKAVQAGMRDVDHGGRVFEWTLHHLMSHHRDLVDPEQIAAASKRQVFPETCSECIGDLRSVMRSAPGQPPSADLWKLPPCDAIKAIIDDVIAEERGKHGAFLLQDPQVVSGLVELQAAFDSPSTSRRLRNLKESTPKAFKLIKEFLCGPGFHVAPPKADKAEAWTALMTRLRFDWIRDNRTPIYTELSRSWKKRHTPFEQFAHFMAFRDSVPAHFTLNMLTHGQKPALVAALAGDTTAFVLLARLGFAMPSDAAWERTPFLKDSLDTRRYAVLRHLNTYFFRRQFKHPAPIVVQSLAPPPSPTQQEAPQAPALPAMDTFSLPANHPAMRVWEARPPKKSAGSSAAGHASAHAQRHSPLQDQAFSEELPGMSPAQKPVRPGAIAGSWAKMARQPEVSTASPAPAPTAKPAAAPAAKPAQQQTSPSREGSATPKTKPAKAGSSERPSPGSKHATPARSAAPAAPPKEPVPELPGTSAAPAAASAPAATSWAAKAAAKQPSPAAKQQPQAASAKDANAPSGSSSGTAAAKTPSASPAKPTGAPPAALPAAKAEPAAKKAEAPAAKPAGRKNAWGV